MVLCWETEYEIWGEAIDGAIDTVMVWNGIGTELSI